MCSQCSLLVALAKEGIRNLLLKSMLLKSLQAYSSLRFEPFVRSFNSSIWKAAIISCLLKSMLLKSLQDFNKQEIIAAQTARAACKDFKSINFNKQEIIAAFGFLCF